MRLSMTSTSVIIFAVYMIVCSVRANKMDLLQAAVSGSRAAKTMTESIARSCYSSTQTRHDITTSSTCYMSGYTQDRLLGRWWQGTCDTGYITVNEYQTADNEKRVYRDAAQGTPSGFNFESTFACLLPADSTEEDTIPVYELYKESITDFAYVIDPSERATLISDGYVEQGILGRAKKFNIQTRLKQCYQSGNTIHNWVLEEAACPSGYTEELILQGTILSNCDGETNTDLTTLYKYYSATGSHRYLGTSSTAPSGYNLTPVGCILKSTATNPNKIPIYSYSYVSGGDKDSKYNSESVTVSSPWTNDNTIIGYTFSQSTDHLKSCEESTGRYLYTTASSCPSGTTFSHIVSDVYSTPCSSSQIPLYSVNNGTVRRIAVDSSQYISGNSPPGAEFIREYTIGCVVSALSWSFPYPNLPTLFELKLANGNAYPVTSYDILHADYPTNFIGTNTLAVAPQRHRRQLIACYDTTQTRHYYTMEYSCPEGTTYEYTVGRVHYPPCLAGESAINSYVTSGNRKLAASTPSGYTFESLVGCIKSPADDFIYGLENSATTDFRYTTTYTFAAVMYADGFHPIGTIGFAAYKRDLHILKQCWNPSTTLRTVTEYAASCPSGTVTEGPTFMLWTGLDEPNLVKLKQYQSASLTDNEWTVGSSAPIGYSTSIYSSFYVKTVQEPGTYPLYQFRKSGLSSGSDTFLRVNNTYIPPGYSQVGGVLGYVFGPLGVECFNSLFYESCLKQVRSCLLSSATQREYSVSGTCTSGSTDEGVIFRTLLCPSDFDGLYPTLTTYCRFTKGSPETDTLLLPCSSTPPSGYTIQSGNIGCLTTTSSTGFVAVYSNEKTESGDIYRYYGTDSTPLSGYTSTVIGYALSP